MQSELAGSDFLHDEDMAALLQISLEGLRNKVLAGDPLPPRAQLPGMRVRLWPRKEVERWVLQFLISGTAPNAQSVESSPKGRRGRPPKFARRTQA